MLLLRPLRQMHLSPPVSQSLPGSKRGQQSLLPSLELRAAIYGCAQSCNGGARIPLYLAFKNLIPFLEKHLGDVHPKPLMYRTASGNLAHGIPAELIPKVCEVWLDARKANVLGIRQEEIATQAGQGGLGGAGRAGWLPMPTAPLRQPV